MYTYRRFKTSKSTLTILLIGLALVIWGNLGLANLAQAKPSYKHDIPVEVEFRDDGTDRIKSDFELTGSKKYSDEEQRVSTAVGRNKGQFWLDTNTTKKPGAERTLSLDFSMQVAPGDQALPSGFPTGEFFPKKAKIITSRPDGPHQRPDDPYQYDLRAMEEIGETKTVPLLIEFYLDEPLVGENHWWISFGEVPLASVGWEGDGTSGDLVTVTYLGPDGDGKDRWTIEALPDGDPDTGPGAALHCTPQHLYYGNYDLPFKLTITTLEPQAAPPAFSLPSKLTSTWARIKADR